MSAYAQTKVRQIQEVVGDTGTVLLCSLVVGACIWIFDYVAVSAVHLLIGLAG